MITITMLSDAGSFSKAKLLQMKTRKLCYRKDDRAMRAI